jgi:preprotein translocase subunit SecA
LDKELKQRVNNATASMVADMIDEYNESSKNDINTAIGNLKDNLRTKFGYNLAVNTDSSDFKNPENIEKMVIADMEKDMDDKEALIGNEYLSLLIRDNYLHAVDRKWLDHLDNMESLREAVYLRHYAQKNPLVEYKLEGFKIFDKMIDEIRQEIASRLHLIRIQVNEGGPRRPVSRSISAGHSASHSSMGAFGGGNFGSAGGGASPMERASRPDGATVVRNQPKVGRNDPCPCGSGKKYKHCHGR